MHIEELEHYGLQIWHCPSWTAQGCRHGFLGIDLDVKSFPDNLAADNFADAIGANNIDWLDQVHGSELILVHQSLGEELPKADGWILPQRVEKEVNLYAMRTADCFPVMLRLAMFDDCFSMM